MTKQDKIVAQIGPVDFYRGGSTVPKGTEQSLALSEILLNFLNVDSNNSEAIDNYCKKYSYIPLDWSNGFDEAFKQEQTLVRNIALHVIEGNITNADMETVASKLSGVSIKLKLVSESKLEQLNEDLFQLDMDQFYSTLDPKGTKKYLIPVTVYDNRIESIWGSLYNQIRTKLPLKQCKDRFRCRRFFVPSKYRPRQTFCSPECEDRYRKRLKNSL